MPSKKEVRNNMEWMQTISIIASVILCAFYLHKEMKEWKKEVRDDTQAFREEMINQSLRTDKLYEMWMQAREESNTRTDQLYSMFIDLVKEGRR